MFLKLVLALALCAVVTAQTTVSTQYGPVTGVSSSGVRRFLKIPFAAPPVGSLRWKAPQAPAAWTAPFDSTTAPVGCSDFTKAVGTTTEDCLYLSVYSPATIASGTLLPVMVWIHGGTFQSGSATQAPFNFAPQIVTLSGFKVIVVSIQYRLNAYGFLASESLRSRNPDGSVGTWGLQDQQFALNWVKNNIAAFGGDSARVTVFGESAGSSLIATHLVTPSSAGLFQQAILESGPLGDWNAQPMTLAEKNFNKLVAASPCASSNNTIACLEGLTSDQINAAVKTFTPAQPTSLPVIWEPAVDGVVIPAAPAVLARAGQWSNLVPVIIGTNKDEGSVFVINSISPAASSNDFLVWANKTFLPMVGTVASAYYATGGYPSPFWAAERMFGDSQFVCPTRRTARWISGAKVANPPPVYTYQFTRTPSSGSPSVQFLGAYHSAELTFVFNAFPVLNAAELALSQAMVAYWTNFAITGNPNGPGTTVAWPKYSQSTDQNLVLDTTISVQTGLKRSQCDFWDALDNLLTNAGPANCEVFQVFNATTTTSTKQNSGKNKCVCTIYV